MEHCSDFKHNKQTEIKIKKNVCDNRSCFHDFVCVISNRPTSLFRRFCIFLYQQQRCILTKHFLSNDSARNGMYYSTAYVCTVSQYRKRQVAFN